MPFQRYKAVVIGVSAGGMEAMKIILPALPAEFSLSVAIAQHVAEDQDSYLAEYLNRISGIPVKEAEDKEPLLPGHVYIAPAGYHLLIERDHTLSLSVDPRVNYCCPSIDVLFESAADAFGKSLIGAVLTGANSDGSRGLKLIKDRGGCAVVQNPATAESRAMPLAAFEATPVDHLIELAGLAPLLAQLSVLPSGGAYEPVTGRR